MSKSLIHRLANAIAGPPDNLKTPTTDEGLAKHDELPPLEAIRKAWREPGINPKWHRASKQVVRDAMPLLARALDRA